MEVESRHVFDVYNNIATAFHNSRSYKWKSVIDFLDQCDKNSVFADIGCGNGKNVLNIKSPGIFCLDTCLPFLEITKERGFQSISASMTMLPFRDKSIDYVMCVAAFHHLSNRERRIKALNELHRVLTIDGKMFLTIWSKIQPKKTRRVFKEYGDNFVEWNNGNPRYYYIFRIEEIKELLNETGFVIDNHYWDCGNEIFIVSRKKIV